MIRQRSWLTWKNRLVLLDVNVLVYAHREDSRHHRPYLRWLEDPANSDHAFGLSDLVLSRFPRVVTHPRVFTPPSTMAQALTKGNLAPDAFLAALAIESGSEWPTADRDYHRFPDLRILHPIE